MNYHYIHHTIDFSIYYFLLIYQNNNDGYSKSLKKMNKFEFNCIKLKEFVYVFELLKFRCYKLI